MNELHSEVAINRALLTNPALDSGAIAVRGTVFHVFGEAGDHDVTILRDGRVAGRFTVAVQPEGAVPQVNVDLAGLAADADRSGNITAHYAVREGGVMGFHVGQGIGRFAVVISHTAGGGSRTVLDSRGQLPAGDHGFDPAAAHILAGQSIVLLAETPARFLVEPAPSDL